MQEQLMFSQKQKPLPEAGNGFSVGSDVRHRPSASPLYDGDNQNPDNYGDGLRNTHVLPRHKKTCSLWGQFITAPSPAVKRFFAPGAAESRL
jgi:hypothetical protein